PPFLVSVAGWVSSAGCGAIELPSLWIAAQIRATALSRFSNFLTGLQSVKGATPAKLFQTSTSRVTGHSPAALASSFSLRTTMVPAAAFLAVSSACTSVSWPRMLLSVSIVKIIVLLLLQNLVLHDRKPACCRTGAGEGREIGC